MADLKEGTVLVNTITRGAADYMGRVSALYELSGLAPGEAHAQLVSRARYLLRTMPTGKWGGVKNVFLGEYVKAIGPIVEAGETAVKELDPRYKALLQTENDFKTAQAKTGQLTDKIPELIGTMEVELQKLQAAQGAEMDLEEPGQAILTIGPNTAIDDIKTAAEDNRNLVKARSDAAAARMAYDKSPAQIMDAAFGALRQGELQELASAMHRGVLYSYYDAMLTAKFAISTKTGLMIPLFNTWYSALVQRSNQRRIEAFGNYRQRLLGASQETTNQLTGYRRAIEER